MENVPQVKTAIREDRCAFGTVDSWLLWVPKIKGEELISMKFFFANQFSIFKNLIGDKSCHVTDVTNASRTMLMNLKTLNWDDKLCK